MSVGSNARPVPDRAAGAVRPHHVLGEADHAPLRPFGRDPYPAVLLDDLGHPVLAQDPRPGRPRPRPEVPLQLRLGGLEDRLGFTCGSRDHQSGQTREVEGALRRATGVRVPVPRQVATPGQRLHRTGMQRGRLRLPGHLGPGFQEHGVDPVPRQFGGDEHADRSPTDHHDLCPYRMFPLHSDAFPWP